MHKIGKIHLSFRPVSLLLMFCLLFQFISVTSAAAAPASTEKRVTNNVQFLKQLNGTAKNIQQSPPAMNSNVMWPLMSEGFEGTFPQGAWSIYDKDGATNGEYFWGQNTHIVSTGTHSAWVAASGANGMDPGSYSYPNNADSWMVYGPIDLATYNTATFQFKYWNQSELDTDYFGWYTSTDGVNFTGTQVSGDSPGWVSQSIDLSPYYGDSSVWIAFNFTSNETVVDDGAFIDDVLLATSKAFVSDFNTNASGWGQVKGSWRISSGSIFTTRGLVERVSSIVQAGTYTTLNYEARMKRLGCSYCANRLYVRGTTSPLDGYYEWASGYLFQYVNDHYYSVWKTVNGQYTMLQGWTYYPAIKTGWNVLRVTAKGTTLKYYINGILVWSQTSPGLSSGRVGIAMYKDYYSTNNSFSVDWATLDASVPAAGTEENETVSADIGQPVASWNNPNGVPAP